mmetsp:Transcript_41077/g.118118  ORF Transcript_41077/g.118118 Transcript_41077/m.118118 type:complete len:318 (-) Transcript_41077:4-957(-)
MSVIMLGRLHFLFVLLLLQGANSRGDTATPTIPRSNHRSPSDTLRYPPWNTSPSIDEHGFLLKQYRRIPGEWEKEFKLFRKRRTLDLDTPATIRQVPGDGNCLFHSISTCYAQAVNGTHLDLSNSDNLQWLYQNSAKLRAQAVDCLEQPRKLLFLQGHEYLKAQDLVQAAASQYGISGAEYCRLMRQDSYWGGGPEIVALCNVLQRPIHVYELTNERNRFVLRRMACFGSPKFDKRAALHILSADSRFPDLQPGRQLTSGNHFLALFPTAASEQKKSKKRAKLRGGGDDLAGDDGHKSTSLLSKFMSWVFALDDDDC